MTYYFFHEKWKVNKLTHDNVLNTKLSQVTIIVHQNLINPFESFFQKFYDEDIIPYTIALTRIYV